MGRLTQRIVYGDLSGHGLPLLTLGAKSTVYQRGIGPTIEDGFVDDVKDGRITIVPPPERFDTHEVVLDGGWRIAADSVIAATGYGIGLAPLVGHLVPMDPFGRPDVDRTQSCPGQPGLFFIGYWSGICGPMRRMRSEALRVARAAAGMQRRPRNKRGQRMALLQAVQPDPAPPVT